MSKEWHKQTDKPLFPNIFWEAPLNRTLAKKLLIVGGHSKQFAETVNLYQYALAAGMGSAKVVLPESLHRLVGNQPDCLFVSSNPSGSIAKPAAKEILEYANECNGVIFSPELSHNTETVSLLETLFSEISKPIFFGSNVLEMLAFKPTLVLKAGRVILTNTKHLTRFASTIDFPITIKSQESILNKIELASDFTNTHPVALIIDESPLIVATDSNVSTTSRVAETDNASLLMALAATFYVQHTKKYEAITSAMFIFNQIQKSASLSSAAIPSVLRNELNKLQTQ